MDSHKTRELQRKITKLELKLKAARHRVHLLERRPLQVMMRRLAKARVKALEDQIELTLDRLISE